VGDGSDCRAPPGSDAETRARPVIRSGEGEGSAALPRLGHEVDRAGKKGEKGKQATGGGGGEKGGTPARRGGGGKFFSFFFFSLFP